MADEISSRISKLNLTATENIPISFGDIVVSDNNPEMALSLVGKVLTMRPFNFEALKRTLNQIWSLSKGALFRPIENGLFVVQFANERDLAKVQMGCPWSFDQNLVILSDIEGEIQPSDIQLKFCPFWTRLYNLPLAYRKVEYVRRIGTFMGEVLEVDSDGIIWDSSVRMRINIDVTKPLHRYQRISLRNGSSAIVEIKYERLPNFCYCCGLIGHIERDCPEKQNEGKDDEHQWGSWLRASPRKGRQKLKEESTIFL